MASILARHVYGGLVILLRGGLGSGKTVFVRALGNVLGVSGIKSPTFTIESVHDVPGGRFRLIHADLYRLNPLSGSETEMQFDEYLELGGVLLLVEWGERWTNPPARDRWDIDIYPPDGYSAEGTARSIDTAAWGFEAHERMARAYGEIMDRAASYPSGNPAGERRLWR
jgi:tRNA threonylcarbamoyladenosine biosynthesis protein TsaE